LKQTSYSLNMSATNNSENLFDEEHLEEALSSSTSKESLSSNALSTQPYLRDKTGNYSRMLSWILIGNIFFLLVSLVLFFSSPANMKMYKTDKNQLLKDSSFYCRLPAN
jgi:hypothetical protein